MCSHCYTVINKLKQRWCYEAPAVDLHAEIILWPQISHLQEVQWTVLTLSIHWWFGYFSLHKYLVSEISCNLNRKLLCMVPINIHPFLERGMDTLLHLSMESHVGPDYYLSHMTWGSYETLRACNQSFQSPQVPYLIFAE